MSTGPLAHRFSGPIRTDGPFAAFLDVPGSVELLGTGKPVKVSGTLDGHPFEATLMPSGQGVHWLPVRKALAVAIGKSAPGEMVDVELTLRRS